MPDFVVVVVVVVVVVCVNSDPTDSVCDVSSLPLPFAILVYSRAVLATRHQGRCSLCVQLYSHIACCLSFFFRRND